MTLIKLFVFCHPASTTEYVASGWKWPQMLSRTTLKMLLKEIAYERYLSRNSVWSPCLNSWSIWAVFLDGKSRENDFQLVSRVDPSANPFWTINSHPKDLNMWGHIMSETSGKLPPSDCCVLFFGRPEPGPDQRDSISSRCPEWSPTLDDGIWMGLVVLIVLVAFLYSRDPPKKNVNI